MVPHNVAYNYIKRFPFLVCSGTVAIPRKRAVASLLEWAINNDDSFVLDKILQAGRYLKVIVLM